MGSPTQPPPHATSKIRTSDGRLIYPGLIQNAKRNKSSYIQFFIMTGILLSSLRSLGQKRRMHELTEDIAALREDQQTITARINHIKQGLRSEAAAEPTGAFASRLRLLLGDN